MQLEQNTQIIGMIYGFIAFVVVLLLNRSGKLTRKIGIAILAASTLVGFLFFAPMLPLQFMNLVSGNQAALSGPLPMAIALISLFVVLTLVFGRMFCGYVCPIGAVQELAYNAPVKKFKYTNRKVILVIHLAASLSILMLAVALAIPVLSILGIAAFFNLKILSVAFFAFLSILVISIVFYRPFCRFGCPYGLLMALVARVSIFKFTRTSDCIDCGKCEKACPTGEAGREDNAQECYLCGRCVAACPKDALKYDKRRKQG